MDLYLFPIGIVTGTDTSLGKWTVAGAGENAFFEPNKDVKSQPVDSTVMTLFENHTINTREKVPIYKSINYTYEDIWRREYEMIERFFKLVDGKASRCYVLDLAKRSVPTGLSVTGGTVVATISETYNFSVTSGRGGFYGCAYKPNTASFMIGKIISIDADDAITFAASYGDYTTFKKNDVFVYPLVETYIADLKLKPKEFNPEVGSDGGRTYSGNVSFVQYGAG